MTTIKTAFLCIIDAAVFYAALALTLLLRYGIADARREFDVHLIPFSYLLLAWIVVFYVMNLYQLRSLTNTLALIRHIVAAVAASAVISAILFYLLGSFFELTPKTNLFLFSCVFAALDIGARILVIRILLIHYARNRIFFLDVSPISREIQHYLTITPHLGYDVIFNEKDHSTHDLRAMSALIARHRVETLVIPSRLLVGDNAFAQRMYRLLHLPLSIVTATDFYESLFEKAPLNDLDEAWFVREIALRRHLYDRAKRVLDIALALAVGVILLPFALLIALFIRLTSHGPALFTQTRVGKNETQFTLYKFRTMHDGQKGPLWTTEHDTRITSLGKILRASHLDEVPQLWNILRGDISFIGPRAERVELAALYRSLPHYDMRHIVKPGLTGWAQLNYRPSASVEEAYEKLKYDIYYVKNRSLILDLLIVLKTLRLFFVNPD